MYDINHDINTNQDVPYLLPRVHEIIFFRNAFPIPFKSTRYLPLLVACAVFSSKTRVNRASIQWPINWIYFILKNELMWLYISLDVNMKS